MASKKTSDTTKNTKTQLGLTLAPAASTYPISYVEDNWDVVTDASSALGVRLGGTGQYDQHTINEALASGAAIEYDYDTDDSVFDPTTEKGIPSVDACVKVPSYYYTTFDNTEVVGGETVPLDPPAHALTIPITACGNCPIVQVVQDGHVVFCDIDINIGTGSITINWGTTITVNASHPLYISIIG